MIVFVLSDLQRDYHLGIFVDPETAMVRASQDLAESPREVPDRKHLRQLAIDAYLPTHRKRGCVLIMNTFPPECAWEGDGNGGFEISVPGEHYTWGYRIERVEVIGGGSGGHYTPYSGGNMSRTEIFKQQEDVSVVTTAVDERDFVETFTEALRPIAKNGSSPGDLRAAVTAGFDIVAKLRGYKSGVQERRVLTAGRWPHPSEKPVAGAGDNEPTDK